MMPGNTSTDFIGGTAGSVVRTLAWFTAKTIAVESFDQPDPSIDPVLNGLADYLGTHYAILADLYEQMQANVGRGFQYSLRGKSDRELSICLELCKRLQAASFLSLSYDRSDLLLWARPQQKVETVRFFTGGWFERFVECRVCTLLDAHRLSYECLRNVGLRFADGDRASLQLFFLIGTYPLWITCYSGQEHASFLEQSITQRHWLGLPPSSAILVNLHPPQNSTATIPQQPRISISDREGFLSLISTLLNSNGRSAAI
jgi:hypothetical protein